MHTFCLKGSKSQLIFPLQLHPDVTFMYPETTFFLCISLYVFTHHIFYSNVNLAQFENQHLF